MIEVSTINGMRRMINIRSISTIGELRDEKASNVVITLSNGETIFVRNTYEEVKKLYFEQVIPNA